MESAPSDNDKSNLSWKVGSYSFERRQSSAEEEHRAGLQRKSHSSNPARTRSMSYEEQDHTLSKSAHSEPLRESSKSEDWENAQVAFPQSPPSPPRRSVRCNATTDDDSHKDPYFQLSLQPRPSTFVNNNADNKTKSESALALVVPDNNGTVDLEACTGTTLSIATNSSGWAVYHPSEFRSWFDKIHNANTRASARIDSTGNNSKSPRNNKNDQSNKKVRKSRSHYSVQTSRSGEVTAPSSEYDGNSSYYSDYHKDGESLLQEQVQVQVQVQERPQSPQKQKLRKHCTYVNVIILCSVLLLILLGIMGGYVAYTFFGVGDGSSNSGDDLPAATTGTITNTTDPPPSITPDIVQQGGNDIPVNVTTTPSKDSISSPTSGPASSATRPSNMANGQNVLTEEKFDNSEDVVSDIDNELFEIEENQKTKNNQDQLQQEKEDNDENEMIDKAKISNVDFTNTDYTVGVYYYPWYTQENDFHGQNYLRGELDPPQNPVLGEYKQDDPNVISQHLKWSKQANINMWATSWWGQDTVTDRTTLSILDHEELPQSNVKIALFYETKGRVPSDGDVANIYPDMVYISQTYFDKPNYLRIQGRPVIYVYLARWLHRLDKLEVALVDMRSAARDSGYDDIYIVGDFAHETPPSSTQLERTRYPLNWLDAITEFDIFGSMNRPEYAGDAGVELYRNKQEKWRDAAHYEECDFIPSITPGFNDKGVRSSTFPSMSRKLNPGDEYGSLFEALLTNALEQVDRNTGNLFMVNSFNQWHDDTQIEPVTVSSPTNDPHNHTNGKDYEAYGTRYLELLRVGTQR